MRGGERVGLRVELEVGVWEWVAVQVVQERLGLRVDEGLGAKLAERVTERPRLLDGLRVVVGVAVGVADCAADDVRVGVGGVAVPLAVGVAVRVTVGVGEGRVRVRDALRVRLAVVESVAERLGVGWDRDAVTETVGVSVALRGDGVRVWELDKPGVDVAVPEEEPVGLPDGDGVDALGVKEGLAVGGVVGVRVQERVPVGEGEGPEKEPRAEKVALGVHDGGLPDGVGVPDGGVRVRVAVRVGDAEWVAVEGVGLRVQLREDSVRVSREGVAEVVCVSGGDCVRDAMEESEPVVRVRDAEGVVVALPGVRVGVELGVEGVRLPLRLGLGEQVSVREAVAVSLPWLVTVGDWEGGLAVTVPRAVAVPVVVAEEAEGVGVGCAVREPVRVAVRRAVRDAVGVGDTVGDDEGLRDAADGVVERVRVRDGRLAVVLGLPLAVAVGDVVRERPLTLCVGVERVSDGCETEGVGREGVRDGLNVAGVGVEVRVGDPVWEEDQVRVAVREADRLRMRLEVGGLALREDPVAVASVGVWLRLTVGVRVRGAEAEAEADSDRERAVALWVVHERLRRVAVGVQVQVENEKDGDSGVLDAVRTRDPEAEAVADVVCVGGSVQVRVRVRERVKVGGAVALEVAEDAVGDGVCVPVLDHVQDPVREGPGGVGVAVRVDRVAVAVRVTVAERLRDGVSDDTDWDSVGGGSDAEAVGVMRNVAVLVPVGRVRLRWGVWVEVRVCDGVGVQGSNAVGDSEGVGDGDVLPERVRERVIVLLPEDERVQERERVLRVGVWDKERVDQLWDRYVWVTEGEKVQVWVVLGDWVTVGVEEWVGVRVAGDNECELPLRENVRLLEGWLELMVAERVLRVAVALESMSMRDELGREGDGE